MTEMPPKLPHATIDIDAKVRKVELVISNLLRIGVATSLACVVFGMVISFIHHPAYFYSPPDLQKLTAPPPHGVQFPHTLPDVWDGLCHFSGQSIVLVGLILLIATPVMRVAVSIFAFIYQRDRRFTLITTAVLILLLLSFLIGKAGQ